MIVLLEFLLKVVVCGYEGKNYLLSSLRRRESSDFALVFEVAGYPTSAFGDDSFINKIKRHQ
jgi:hypothetical protein